MFYYTTIILLSVTVISSPPDKLGIIGQPISDYDPNSLRYIERSESEDESEVETEERESDIGEPYEDHTSGGAIDIDDDDSELG